MTGTHSASPSASHASGVSDWFSVRDQHRDVAEQLLCISCTNLQDSFGHWNLSGPLLRRFRMPD